MNMKRFIAFSAPLLALTIALIGCGGSDAPKTATISGRVVFPDGKPVRGASISSRDGSTTTTSNGDYVLPGQGQGDILVRAEITDAGTKYIGQNMGRTYVGEQRTSINIMVVPQNQSAMIHGTVEDRDGYPLQNARVFALGASGISSHSTITNKDGKFELRYLLAGTNYEVNAGGATYRSDTESVNLAVGEDRTIRFVLGNPGAPVLDAPANLGAIAWTAPISRDPATASVLENIKRLTDPRHKSSASTRLSPLGSPISVELEWDPQSFADLYGYAIYRGSGSSTPSAVDFYREPISSTYIDADSRLVAGLQYNYQVTTCDVNYPQDSGSESPRSNLVSVTPLSDLTLRSTSFNPLTFKWNPVSGANSYVVFLFDEFPGYGVDSIWNNSSARATGTQVVYNGSVALTKGKTYYFLVMGLNSDDSARTLSEIGAFIYTE